MSRAQTLQRPLAAVRSPLAGDRTERPARFYRAADALPPTAGASPDRLLTVPEAAAALRVSKWTLYELIRSRRLVTITIGSRRLVPADSIRTFIERLRAEGGER